MAGQLCGCRTPREVSYCGDAELQYYKRAATQVDYAHVHTEVDPAVQFAERPPTIRDPYQGEIWDLTLPDAIQIALNNSTILRSRVFKNPANPLMSNNQLLQPASRLDPAIQETNSNFIYKGTEAALSAFDTQFKTSMDWGRNETAQNNPLLSAVGTGQTLVQETAQFQSSLSKVFAYGGSWDVSHNWSYSGTNQQFNLFPSSYRGFIETTYRQPLLAGAGAEFTRIKGPILRTIPGFTNIGGGVVIARINNDITIADFELSVTNMVRDVEDLYWELYLSYRTFNAQQAAQKAAFSFWNHTKQRLDVGRGSVVDETQARENYFNSRVGLENAATTLYGNEGQLRRILGLPVSDGKIIRPVDEPLMAEYVIDWRLALTESLVRRAELRKQKWTIKSRELELVAAESLVKPRLDFLASYRVNGFGDELISQQSADGITDEGFNSAYTSLTRGNQTGWGLGLDFTLPIGLRQALAQKRNAELQLTKARAVLAAQELEISHELAHSVQLVDALYQIAKTNFDRMTAASQSVNATQREYELGRIPIDLLLRSEANKASAEVGYFTALVKYNQAINDMRVRRGTLLEENNIHLSESDWTPEAYDEALRRAWARSYAKPAPKLDTQPPEFVEGDWGRYVLDGHDMSTGLPVPSEMGGTAIYGDGPPPSPAAALYDESMGLNPAPAAEVPPVLEPSP